MVEPVAKAEFDSKKLEYFANTHSAFSLYSVWYKWKEKNPRGQAENSIVNTKDSLIHELIPILSIKDRNRRSPTI